MSERERLNVGNIKIRSIPVVDGSSDLVKRYEVLPDDLDWLVQQAVKVERYEQALQVIKGVREMPDEVLAEVDKALEGESE